MIEDFAGERAPSPRPRPALALVPGQVRCQLLVLVRSPLPAFITLVVPVMLLVALDLVTPEMTLHALGGVRVAQFLTPAMASFAVLNAGFVDTVVGTTLARERGILKLLRATPLPGWVYLAGRLGATLVVGAGSVAVVTVVGLLLLHAHLAPGGLGPFVAAAAAGLVTSFALGVAVAGVVSTADSALPVSYAILLPIAFISGVFFPAPTEAHWLRALSDALPAAPVARALEAAFARGPAHGPTAHQLLVLTGWTLAATGIAAWRFGWEPAGARRRRGAQRTHRRASDRAPTT